MDDPSELLSKLKRYCATLPNGKLFKIAHI